MDDFDLGAVEELPLSDVPTEVILAGEEWQVPPMPGPSHGYRVTGFQVCDRRFESTDDLPLADPMKPWEEVFARVYRDFNVEHWEDAYECLRKLQNRSAACAVRDFPYLLLWERPVTGGPQTEREVSL